MLNEKGVKLLQKIIHKKQKKIELENCFSNEEEFFYECKLLDKISENNFEELEREIE